MRLAAAAHGAIDLDQLGLHADERLLLVRQVHLLAEGAEVRLEGHLEHAVDQPVLETAAAGVAAQLLPRQLLALGAATETARGCSGRPLRVPPVLQREYGIGSSTAEIALIGRFTGVSAGNSLEQAVKREPAGDRSS